MLDRMNRNRLLFDQYPVPDGQVRIEMELWGCYSSPDLIPWWHNPHAHIPEFNGLPAWYPFYSSRDWSTVFRVADRETLFGRVLHLFAEQGHQNPWGEQIRLTSTAENFESSNANRYALFRGRYWEVVSPVFHCSQRTMGIDMAIEGEDVAVITRQRLSGDSFEDYLNSVGSDYESMLLFGNNRVWNSYGKSRKDRNYRIDWAKNGF